MALPSSHLDSENDEDERIKVKDFGATTTLSFAQPAPSDEESDEDVEFEAVGGEADLANAPKKKQVDLDGGDLEIVLQQPDQQRAKEKGKAKRPGLSGVERKLRVDTHKVHLLCLIVASRVRNAMLNDQLLQARLLSSVPLSIQNAFATITVQRFEKPVDRSRAFDLALKDLVSFWWHTFKIEQDIPGVTTRTWAQAARDHVYTLPTEEDTTLTDRQKKAIISKIPGETIRTADSLSRRALMNSGSIDMKAQLFVSVCRAINLPVRLVVSLQPLDWRAAGGPALATSQASSSKEPIEIDSATDSIPSGKGKSRAKGKAGPSGPRKPKKQQTGIQKLAKTAGLKRPLISSANEAISVSSRAPSSYKGTTTEESEIEMEPVVIKGSSSKGKQRANGGTTSDGSVISVKSTSTKGRGGFMTDDDDPSERMRVRRDIPVKLRSVKRKAEEIDYEKSDSPDQDEKAIKPVYWAEVYSRANKEWIAVDVTRKMMRCAIEMEPAKKDPSNKMAYVIALEEDNTVRDVTARYVKSFGASTLKVRAPNVKGEGDWWENLLEPFKRGYALERDHAEDEQLQRVQSSESMPANMAGYKDHPLYVLERHLKREEALSSRRSLGVFRDELVFPRSAVVVCKSADQYMREGLQVKSGEQPMKMVKARAMTINKRRAHEQALAEGRDEDTMQGLYSLKQTEKRIPEPIIEGKVPKNAYGNLDLFAPHMLPRGGIHLPYKGTAKVAKQLGIDYAEAVTGFEFHKRRAIPVVEGIVVPVEQQEVIMDAYWEQAHDDFERAFTKKQERCLKRWKKLINGLAIRNRLQQEYGDGAETAASGSGNVSIANGESQFVEESQLNATLNVKEEEEAEQPKAQKTKKQATQVHNALPPMKTLSPAKKRKTYLTIDTSEEESSDDGSEEFEPKEEDEPPKKRTRASGTPTRATRASANGKTDKPKPRRSLRSNV